MRSIDKSMRWSILPTMLVASMLMLAACAPEGEDPFIPRYVTERLRVGTSFDSELCLGHIDMWETHIDVIEETFDLSRDFAWVFVYLDDETDEIAAACEQEEASSGLLGCWRNSVVRGTLAAIPHELVHAWTATFQSAPLPILREGIAVWMYGTTQRIGVQKLTVDELTAGDVSGSLYAKAGHFVAWLLETYGPETFKALYARASVGMDPAEVSEAFVDVLGATSEEVLLAYGASAKRYYPAVGAAACGQGPLIPWQDDAATWLAEGSCSQGPFFGMETGGWWQRVTIDVSTVGTYLLDTGGRQASLTRCLTAPVDQAQLPELQAWITGDWLHEDPMEDLDYAAPGDAWVDLPLELDVGIYEVWVERRSNELPGVNDEMRLLRL